MDYSSLEDLLEWYMPSQEYLHRRDNNLSHILLYNVGFSDHVKRSWLTYDSETKKIILSRAIHTLSSYQVIELLEIEANSTANGVILEMLLMSVPHEEMVSLHVFLTQYIDSNWRRCHECTENHYTVVTILTSHPCLQIEEYLLGMYLRYNDVNLVQIILQHIQVTPAMVMLGLTDNCTSEIQSMVLDSVLNSPDTLSEPALFNMGHAIGWETHNGIKIKTILDERRQSKCNCALM